MIFGTYSTGLTAHIRLALRSAAGGHDQPLAMHAPVADAVCQGRNMCLDRVGAGVFARVFKTDDAARLTWLGAARLTWLGAARLTWLGIVAGPDLGAYPA